MIDNGGLSMNHKNNKRNWELVYGSYEGMERKAMELIYQEMGAQILRDTGIYTLHVLACRDVKTLSALPIDKNAVLIGLHQEHPLIRDYIQAEEIPQDGYVVKVMVHPVDEALRLVIITANDPCALFYGAVDYVDDYFTIAAPIHGGAVKLHNEIFDSLLPEYYHASAPAIKTRGIFTWGHPINDYRNYIENMARLRLNQLIIWNDFVPLNAKDIVDYAHEFGIQIIWGFAWGWSRNCKSIDFNTLDQLTDDIIRTYEEQYLNTGADGIYFQSFTEMAEDMIGDRLVAEVVTDFVNQVSGRLLDKYPDLFIQFGLHATSVKDHLSFLANVDPRVEIMWEDCGSFPYGYDPAELEEEDYLQTKAFTDDILSLRETGGVSMLFKGQMVLDWVGDRFVHQAGPFILGMSSERLKRHDREMLKPIWRNYQTGWMLNGKYAHDMARHIHESGKKVTIGMAGQFAGGLWFPEALCAQILWECDKPYEEIFDKVTRRRSIDIV